MPLFRQFSSWVDMATLDQRPSAGQKRSCGFRTSSGGRLQLAYELMPTLASLLVFIRPHSILVIWHGRLRWTVANAHRRWTMGSVLFLASWAVLMGPITYSKSFTVKLELTRPSSCSCSNKANVAPVQHLFSGPRLPFTGAYFGSIALTIYFSIGVSSASSLLILPAICLAPCRNHKQPCTSMTSPVITHPCRY
jgi:Got1/Sft2-like family